MIEALSNTRLKGNTKRLSEFAEELSLFYDDNFDYLYGVKNGYKLIIEKPLSLSRAIIMAVKKDDGTTDIKDIGYFLNSYPIIKHCRYKNHHLKLTIKHRLQGPFNKYAIALELNKFIEDFVEFLANNGYHDCCQNCGSDSSSFAVINEGKFLFCDNCYDIADILVESKATTINQADEKYTLGVLGAICGSLIGALAIVFFDQYGFPLIFAGFLTAFFTLKGYRVLAGQQSKKGLIICIVIMITVSYISHRFSWAYSLAEYYEADLWMIFSGFNSLILDGYVNTKYYIFELFTLISALIAASGNEFLTIIKNHFVKKSFNI